MLSQNNFIKTFKNALVAVSYTIILWYGVVDEDDDDDDGNIDRVVAVVERGGLPLCCCLEEEAENKDIIEEGFDNENFFLWFLFVEYSCFSLEAEYIEESSEIVEKQREVIM